MKVMLHLSSWNLISRLKQNFKPNVADLEPGWFKLIDHWSCDEVSNSCGVGATLLAEILYDGQGESR